MNTKNIIIGFVVVAVIAIGGYFFPRNKVSQSFGASPTGATFGDAKRAAVVINPLVTGQNGTSTTLVNTDSNNRIVTDSFVDCNGVGNPLTAGNGTGLATWTLQIATTSTASPASVGSNLVANITISTSTSDTFNATSTNPGPNPVGRIWPAGGNLTFFLNATTTGACTAGVNYIGS
jgi:hypothetical protein